MRKCITSFLLLVLCSCSGPSPESYREQGSALIRTLIKDLKKVRTKEELVDRQEKIHQTFIKLKETVMEAESYLKAHPKTEIPLFTRQDQDLSDELQIELNRLLRIDGCREVLNNWFIE